MRTEKSEKSEKGKFGLKRLGTVIGRRRQSTNPYAQSRSPERKKSTNDVRASPFNRFSRKESHQRLETLPSSPPLEAQRATTDVPPTRLSDSGAPQLEPISSITSEGPNGINTVSAREATPSPAQNLTNGTQAPVGALQEPLRPTETFEVGSCGCWKSPS